MPYILPMCVWTKNKPKHIVQSQANSWLYQTVDFVSVNFTGNLMLTDLNY